MSAEAPVAAAPVAVEAALKVFVSNLSFTTKREALAEHFAPAGSVVEARIITRGPRSKGYGFVTFPDEASIAKAVELFNGSELDGREITVEKAKPEPVHSAERPKRAPRTRESKPARIDDNGAPAAGADAGADASEGADSEARRNGKARRFRPRKTSGQKDGAADDATDSAAAPAQRKPRAPRAPKSGEKSDVTVFVANLPFSMDDAGLAKLFEAYKVTKARVVYRKDTTRSKGYGFVDFADNSEQLKAIADFEKIDTHSEGRKIGVSAALAQPAAESTDA
ncbi:hypothetical protein GQ42DRAFT_180464 [Ramicandelaber brevisporus]|nr:hypothetical protein GQ42DRAFT_180464 [Ramicandelaber brevisporus]